MRKLIVYGILVLFLLPSCNKSTGSSITVVKPKYHYRFYSRKNDKRTKRVKMVKMRN